jgi:hypothetical protein
MMKFNLHKNTCHYDKIIEILKKYSSQDDMLGSFRKAIVIHNLMRDQDIGKLIKGGGFPEVEVQKSKAYLISETKKIESHIESNPKISPQDQNELRNKLEQFKMEYKIDNESEDQLIYGKPTF